MYRQLHLVGKASFTDRAYNAINAIDACSATRLVFAFDPLTVTKVAHGAMGSALSTSSHLHAIVTMSLDTRVSVALDSAVKWTVRVTGNGMRLGISGTKLLLRPFPRCLACRIPSRDAM